MTYNDAWNALQYAREHPEPIQSNTLQSMLNVADNLVCGGAGDAGRNGGVVIYRLVDEVKRIQDLIRDYYTVEKFPTDQFIRLALGDNEARKLGIVIDAVEETRVAIENGWIEP